MNLRYLLPALVAFLRYLSQLFSQYFNLALNTAISGFKEATGGSRPYAHWPGYMIDEIVDQLREEIQKGRGDEETERILKALLKERKLRSTEGDL